MRVESVHRTIEASPVGAAIVAMMENLPAGFDGTIKDLMMALSDYKPAGESWPMSAKGMGDALRRLTTSMKLIGVDIRDKGRTKHGYAVRISRPVNMVNMVHIEKSCTPPEKKNGQPVANDRREVL